MLSNKRNSIMKKLISIFIFLVSLNVNAQETWNLIHYNEFIVPSRNIFYINQDEAWAIGTGDIVYTDDGGISWTTQYNEPDYYFVSVYFTDNQTGWVVGWSEVLKTIDGGQNWILQELPNPLGLDIESVFFLNQDTGWIAGSYKSIYYTENGGEDWFVQHPYQLEQHYFLYDIKFFDNLNGCAVGGKLLSPGQGFIMVTNNGGVEWIEFYPPSSEELIKIQYLNSEEIWACDRAGKLFKSINGGVNWEMHEDSFNNLNDMHFFNDNNALAISSGYRIHRTDDAWQSWHTYYLGFFGDMNKFSFANEQTGLGVGNQSLLKTEDGGWNWTRLNEKFIDIDFFNEDVGFAIQQKPNMNPMKTIDGGLTWEELNLNIDGYITNLDFISENTGFMTNSYYKLLKTFDAGNTWDEFDLPINSTNYNDLQFMDENTGFLATQNSDFVKTIDGGSTWEIFNFSSVNYLNTLFFLDHNNGWIAGTDGFIGITNDGGETWNTITVGSQTIIDVWFTSSQNGFILTNGGDVYRTVNGGYSWEGLVTIENSPSKINFTDEDKGWVICRNKIYFTEDNGGSWSEEFSIDWTIDKITGFTSISSENQWICTENGRIYKRSSLTDIPFLQANNNGIICYPNPAKERLYVEIDQPVCKNYKIDIYSVEGKSFDCQKVKLFGSNTFEIMLDGLPSGIYFLRISDNQEIKVLKFVKG